MLIGKIVRKRSENMQTEKAIQILQNHFWKDVTINIFVNFIFLSYQEAIFYQNRVISSEDDNLL